MTLCEKCIFVLSTSKLVLHALVPMLLEHTTDSVLLVTTRTEMQTVTKVQIENAPEHTYQLLYAEQENSLSEFMSHMRRNQIRVGVIHIDSPLYPELLRVGDGAIWLSACREGVLHYIEELKPFITHPTLILCFDNDSNLIIRAQHLCSSSFICVHKCVAHSVCTTLKLNHSQETISLLGGEECFLVFPPEAEPFKQHLKSNIDPLSTRAQLRFASTPTEYQFLTDAKAINVNALHTAICILAYTEGDKQSLSLEAVSNMPIGTVLDKSFAIEKILQLHARMFDKYLSPVSEQLGESKYIHTETARRFANHLFSSPAELIGRGLSPNREIAENKLCRHLPLIQGADDPFFNTVLAAYEKLYIS